MSDDRGDHERGKAKCPDCYDGNACMPGGCGVPGCKNCGKPCPTCGGTCEVTSLLAELGQLHKADDEREPNTCARCHETCVVEFGDEASLLCHDCAHWVVDQLPSLLAQARLAAELTALLCTEEGQDVVERAKALVETERGSERLAADRRANKRHVIEHEDLERLIADAKRSGYVSAIGALHNAMPPGFVEPDADKVIGRVVAALAEKDTIEASLRSRVELLTQKLTDCEGALDQYRALATTADNLEQENARLREHIRTARKS
jgi:hypothetical protein